MFFKNKGENIDSIVRKSSKKGSNSVGLHIQKKLKNHLTDDCASKRLECLCFTEDDYQALQWLNPILEPPIAKPIYRCSGK